MLTLKLVPVGNSTGIVLPREALSRLKLSKGDTVYLTEAPDGWRLTAYDPDFSRQMEQARKVMKDHRAVLHELAK
jgi:putative addiction module antidote